VSKKVFKRREKRYKEKEREREIEKKIPFPQQPTKTYLHFQGTLFLCQFNTPNSDTLY
tara:strand:+ start:411 stop:584 length:174 start_codon:yes stop_codon:yes gene_type:complete